MTDTNPAARRRPLNFDDLTARFPVGLEVVIENPRAHSKVKATVRGVRPSGEVGTRGHSLFIETEEDRGPNAKPRVRLVRPAYCRAA